MAGGAGRGVGLHAVEQPDDREKGAVKRKIAPQARRAVHYTSVSVPGVREKRRRHAVPASRNRLRPFRPRLVAQAGRPHYSGAMNRRAWLLFTACAAYAVLTCTAAQAIGLRIPKAAAAPHVDGT